MYRKNINKNKTPLEDFTTEILVGTLENNQEILNHFVNEVLKIEGSSFKINSQKKYNLPGDINCIIDMVIENSEIVCFVENKIDSGEGDRQLERYLEVLKDINLTEDKKVFLRYCTKYYDQKDIYLNFLQFRWSDIYSFFEQYSENVVAANLLEYLRSEGMASAGNFDFNDLLVMTKINSTIAKMDECLDLVKPSLCEYFGKPYQYDYERLKQICKNEMYAMWCTNVLGEGYSEVLVGFKFTNDSNNAAPNLVVQLYLNKDNSKSVHIGEINQIGVFEYFLDDEGFVFWFEKPLSDFISSQNQIEEICDWFKDKIKKIYDLNTLTSLIWNKS